MAWESTRPEKPDADDSFTPEIWALAERCWAHAPSNRPSAKDVCDALEVAVAPCISGSTHRNPSNKSHLESLESEPPGIRGSARQEQHKPSAIDGRADIPPVPSVHVPKEIAEIGVEGESTLPPAKRLEEKISEGVIPNNLMGGPFTPGTLLTKPTVYAFVGKSVTHLN